VSSVNPFKPGDTVSIERGAGRLSGTVVKTILARVHIQIEDRVYVEDWHTCRRRKSLTQER
jgi:hypothetical protein